MILLQPNNFLQIHQIQSVCTAFPPKLAGVYRFLLVHPQKVPIDPIPTSCSQGSPSVSFIWSATLYFTDVMFHVTNALETVVTEEKNNNRPIVKEATVKQWKTIIFTSLSIINTPSVDWLISLQ